MGWEDVPHHFSSRSVNVRSSPLDNRVLTKKWEDQVGVKIQLLGLVLLEFIFYLEQQTTGNVTLCSMNIT